MTKITITPTRVTCDGHAGDRIACSMLTALTVAFVTNLTERIGLSIPYTLQPGYFDIATDGITGDGRVLVESYLYAIRGLAKSYPEQFTIEETAAGTP